MDPPTTPVSTGPENTPASVVDAAVPTRRLPAAVQRMVDHINASRMAQVLRLDLAAQRKAARKPAAGLWPVDTRGQYVSAKPTSKRNRRAVTSTAISGGSEFYDGSTGKATEAF